MKYCSVYIDLGYILYVAVILCAFVLSLYIHWPFVCAHVKLLALTIQQEKPELETEKTRLLQQEEDKKIQLAQLEESLLEVDILTYTTWEQSRGKHCISLRTKAVAGPYTSILQCSYHFTFNEPSQMHHCSAWNPCICGGGGGWGVSTCPSWWDILAGCNYCTSE